MAEKKIMILPILSLFSMILPLANSINFHYPTVFNFGDSNSDTGGLAAGLGFRLPPPNGQIYFKTSSGRFCDGRLIIDFLSNFLSHFSLNQTHHAAMQFHLLTFFFPLSVESFDDFLFIYSLP